MLHQPAFSRLPEPSAAPARLQPEPTDNDERILSYLRRYHPAALTLVTEGRPADDVAARDLCDVVFTLFLIGHVHLLTADGAAAFAKHVCRWRLAGHLNASIERSRTASVHLTAYLLAAAVLLRSTGHDISQELVGGGQWRLHELFDADLRPRWPAKWSHHAWRVSHWVGGAPSILLSLSRLAPERCRDEGAPELAGVLAASDALVDGETGLLRTYRSEFLQSLFRTAYRLRHDPEVGDVGGVVHLQWINHAVGRLPYKGAGALFERAAALLTRAPFIERTPYCLDFDVIQIVRTAAPSPTALSHGLRARARRLAEDISGFFATGLTQDYGLHRLPGALAAQHESALITGERAVHGLATRPVDIIRAAGWI
jgi:hypothetical protein